MIITNLLTNMVVLTIQSVIPTNTPAFEQYVFHTMFTNAQVVASCCHLDQSLITTDKISYFKVTASPAGFSSDMVFGTRYAFRTDQGEFHGFCDKPFTTERFTTDNARTNDAVLESMMNATNLLTQKKAQQIAESAARSMVPMDKMGFKKPKEIQLKYEWKDGKTYLLPYYRFRWEADKGVCQVDVSGLTSNIVDFFFVGPYLRLQQPTNYLEMLGLPTNTVFVERWYLPGQPPQYKLYEPRPQQ